MGIDHVQINEERCLAGRLQMLLNPSKDIVGIAQIPGACLGVKVEAFEDVESGREVQARCDFR